MTPKLKFVNESFARIAGYSVEEIIGMDFRDLVAPEDKELVVDRYTRRLKGEKVSAEYEFRLIQKDGTIITVDMNVGAFTYFGRIASIGILKDITQRKLSEEKLRQHEIRLEDMLKLHRLSDVTEREILDFSLEASLRAVQSDFAFIGMMTADEAFMINHVRSKKVMSMSQISEKLVEHSIAQAGLWGEVVRQRRPIIVNDYSTSKEFNKGYPQRHVPIKRLLRIPIFNGTRIVAIAGVANKASDYTESDANALTSLIHEMWDILEHRGKDEDVSKNRAMLLNAQELGHVGSWEWDIVTNNLVWSKEVYTIYGLDPQKVTPKYELVLNTMSPESKTEFSKAIDDALTLKKIFELECSLIRPDGSRSYVHTKGEVIFDKIGHPIKMFGMVQDITKRKQAEEERTQLLAKENAARTDAEAARKLSLMKSMFIASTSHELRTPLNSIIGFSSLILAGLSGELNPEQKTQIGIVHSSATHLLALISDIIDLSKIEAGNVDVNISPFDLGQIIHEAVATLDSSIKDKGLDVSVEGEKIQMRTDRMRLFQCLLNLIGNSVKYTEKGSIKIIAQKRDNYVDISVTDTGIGIKTEDIPRLFEPFVRFESPLTLKTSGTGLGLYLTQKLARDFLRGEIDVKSEYGKGSTFILKIPVEIQKPDGEME